MKIEMHLTFAPNLEGRFFELKERDKFRHAEKCLYEYKQNMAGLKVLREDLRVVEASTDVHVQNYECSIILTGNPSSPPESRVIKIEGIQRRIKELERYTKPITELIENLTSPDVLDGSNKKMMMDILRLMYFGGNVPDVIVDELNITRRTFFRLRRELVYTAITYLAL